MNPSLLRMPLFVFAVLVCASGGANAGDTGVLQTKRVEITERQGAATPPRSKRGESARDAGPTGRRLTAAELAQLREQVRQQWVPRRELVVSSETQPAERVVPAPLPGAATEAGTVLRRP